MPPPMISSRPRTPVGRLRISTLAAVLAPGFGSLRGTAFFRLLNFSLWLKSFLLEVQILDGHPQPQTLQEMQGHSRADEGYE